MFLADIDTAQFALPKSYLQHGVPSYRGIARRLHLRRLNGGLDATKVNAGTSIIQTTKPTKLSKRPNPLKLKRRLF